LFIPVAVSCKPEELVEFSSWSKIHRVVQFVQKLPDSHGHTRNTDNANHFLNHFVLCSNTGANELPYKRAQQLGFSQNNDGISSVATLPGLKFPVILLALSMLSQDSALPPNRLGTSGAVCHIVTIQIPPYFCKHYRRTTGNEGDVSAARTHARTHSPRIVNGQRAGRPKY